MEDGQQAVSDSSCQACTGTWPGPDHFLGDLGLSKAYLHEDQFFPGWTVLIFHRHATELFQLTSPERAQLMEEVSHVASALSEVYQAKKINYELLGNQLPHIHWHVIPRLPDDPAPLEPVWRVSHDTVRLTGSSLHDTIDRVRSALRKNR
ncbi:MAG TPA: HIT family protein [Nitrospira sp.]|nr:HIT family protein [Nitrospira sp.]